MVGWQPSKGFAIWQVFLPEICLNFFPKTEVWTLQHHGRCTQLYSQRMYQVVGDFSLLHCEKKGMNSSSMILVLRKCGCAFGVLSILFLRRDHSPCSEKPRSLTGAARRQEAHDAALAPSAVRLSGCAKTGRWDPVRPRRSEMGRDGSRRAPWFFKWLMPGQFTRGSSPLPRLQFLR